MVASLHPDLQRGEPDIASIDIAPVAPGNQIEDGSLFSLAPGQVAGLSGLPES